MEQIAAMIRELAQLAREIHENRTHGNCIDRQISARLKAIEERADALLPERPRDAPPISEDRTPAEWDRLVRGHAKPKLVK